MSDRIAPDRTISLIVLLLLGFGMVMTSSVSGGELQRVVLKQAIFTVLGVAIMFIVMRIDYDFYRRPIVLGAFIVLTYALLVGCLISPPINNTHRWLVVGPLRAQPSELAKLAVVLFTAFSLTRLKGRDLRRRDLAVFLGVIFGILGLVLSQPDFGTATSIGLTSAILLFLGGLKIRYYGLALLAAIPGFYLLVYRVDYRWKRILAFFDSTTNVRGSGYQVDQSLIAVGSGGIGGKGFAQSTQKLNFLPEAHNDFIFSIIGEELGLIGVSSLLVLFFILFWKGVQVSLRSGTPFGTLVGLGITSMIVVQMLINVSVALGLMPAKGMPLPFISAGGSSLLVNTVAVGILLNISSHPRNPHEPPWYKKRYEKY